MVSVKFTDNLEIHAHNKLRVESTVQLQYTLIKFEL